MRTAINAAAVGLLLIVVLGRWVAVPAGCDLPWDSLAQVERCGSDEFRGDEANSGAIWVASDDSRVIAGALATAFGEREPGVTQVFAYPPRETMLGLGGGALIRSDNGYVAEWTEGEFQFEVCTSWSPYDSTELCDDWLGFSVSR